MEHAPCISYIATLLADPKRSAMLWALIDGSARASEELASVAGLSASSATAHLARLSAGGLLTRESRGRQRFFKLAAPEVGAAVEALASVSVAQAEARPADKESLVSMRQARLCHDHLGGEVAAGLYERISRSGWIESHERGAVLTQKGSLQLARWGIFTQALVHRERETVCACCDWSSRRPHLGGALGASLLTLFAQSGWIKLRDDSRAVEITELGSLEIGRIGEDA